ncbi:MAG: OsmC family protein [Actinobacteria bacterium]|nr:MAG: OsmC family protein [Actinomycetota bacterium]
MAAKGKEFRYAVSIERDGRIGAEGLSPLATPDGWSPEHLVLAGLVRCSLTSLRYHAERIGVDVVGSGSAASTIARREADGRFAFAEIELRLDLELEPEPPGEELAALLAKAERDCFIGASLTVGPRYHWTVNGRDVAAAL